MPNYDIIEGAKRDHLMEHLVANNTLVNISVPKTAFERLTVITRLQPPKAPSLFGIDPPVGLFAALQDHQAEIICFEFTGPDQLQYGFEAVVETYSKDEVWLQYPNALHRFQQRAYVRILPDSSSHIILNLDQTHLILPIENISLGGALCCCPNNNKPMIGTDGLWEEVPVELALGLDLYHLVIKRIRVKRIIPGTRPRHFGLALEFIQLSNPAHHKLQQFINSFQRRRLKQRNKA